MSKRAFALALLIAAAFVDQTVDAAAELNPTLSLAQLRAKYADRQGHLTDIGGVEIYYKDEGAGPAVLLVHGSASTLDTYDVVAARLRKHYRVIRYDVPGQGLSGAVSDAAALALKPSDIAERLLQKLKIGRITAVGVSSGGTLCIYLAAQRPELVERLILANTPADPVDTSHMQQPADFLDAQREARETHFQSRHFWELFLAFFAGVTDRMTPAMVDRYYDFNRRTPDRNALSLVAKVEDHDKAVQAMGQVSAPTLLVWGERDPLLIPASADVLAGYLSHSQVSKLLLPDVGHFPPMEVAERFADIVSAYIEAVTPEH